MDPIECVSPPELRAERDPFSESLCSTEYRTMDKVEKASYPECYTASSESINIYL
jgi:hypothetical protein